MPFIIPNELIEYTEIDAVKFRNTTKLSFDILEAEADIKDICGHDFSDAVTYPTIPEEVKLAALKLSQYYAVVNSDENIIKGIRSQNIGDLSFTSDGLEKPSVTHLLRSHIKKVNGQTSVTFRMSGL